MQDIERLIELAMQSGDTDLAERMRSLANTPDKRLEDLRNPDRPIRYVRTDDGRREVGAFCRVSNGFEDKGAQILEIVSESRCVVAIDDDHYLAHEPWEAWVPNVPELESDGQEEISAKAQGEAGKTGAGEEERAAED